MPAGSSTHMSLLGRLRDPEDAAAWFDFHQRYAELISRVGRAHGLQAADREDVVQDVLIERKPDDAGTRMASASAYLQMTDSAEAYDGLGVVYRHLEKLGQAVPMHMEAIGRLHHRPQSHINLGLALAQLGRLRWAVRAFETALEMAPDHPIAHQALAQLYDIGKQTPEKAAHHRKRAAETLARMRNGATRDATPAAGTDPDR